MRFVDVEVDVGVGVDVDVDVVVVSACVRGGWPVTPGEGARPFTRCLTTALLGTHCVWVGKR